MLLRMSEQIVAMAGAIDFQNECSKKLSNWKKSSAVSTGMIICLCVTMLCSLLFNTDRLWMDTKGATTLIQPVPRNSYNCSIYHGEGATTLHMRESISHPDTDKTKPSGDQEAVKASKVSQMLNSMYMDPTTITSADLSTVTLVNEPVIGQLLHFMIQARDVNNRTKTSGGDMWFVTASSIKGSFYTSARVIDNLNGSYSAYMYAGWIHSAKVRVKLVFSSHAAYFIEEKYWTSHLPRVYWFGIFKQGIETEEQICHITVDGWNDTVCAYPRPVAMGEHTAFVCDKPSSLPCESLNAYIVNRKETNRSVLNFGVGNMWLLNGLMEYHGSAINVTLKSDENSTYDPFTKLNQCLPDEPNPLSHGFWNKAKWVSLVCANHQWTPIEAGTCLRDKSVYLLGDSTTRQWYKELVELLGGNSHLKGLQEYDVKTKVIREFNTTVHWKFHPWSIGTTKKFMSNLNYEVDILDELGATNCSNYITVISPWAHFTQWPRSAYIERLRLLKLAVERLKAKCPGVPVVVKGPHPRLDMVETPTNLFAVADFILYKMNSIMRDMFFGIGVHYIDIWDLNLSHPHANTIHMPASVVRQEVFMFLSHVCNT